MLESIFTTINESSAISITSFALSLLTAVGLGLMISLLYIKTQKTHLPSQSFALTLVMLPVVVTVIILLVGSNVARAFSLAGAFSIIRFRSAPGDSKDITYVLFTMAIGLSIGMGYLFYALLITICFCLTMGVLEILHFGKPGLEHQLLKITIPEDLNYRNVFDPILKHYTHHFRLIKVRTTDLGSLYELIYQLNTSPNTDYKQFIDELRTHNGNLTISLILQPDHTEL